MGIPCVPRPLRREPETPEGHGLPEGEPGHCACDLRHAREVTSKMKKPESRRRKVCSASIATSDVALDGDRIRTSDAGTSPPRAQRLKRKVNLQKESCQTLSGVRKS